MSHISRLSSRGFTLMELLIVILIIGVLAGLLMPAIMIAKEASRKAKTRSIIAHAASAVERYRTQNGAYPNLSDSGLTLRESLEGIDADAYSLRSPNIQNGRIVDAWETPIHYQSFEEYGYSAGTNTPPTADDDPAPNPDSFQIWSAGPDLTDHRGAGDDINNWTN